MGDINIQIVVHSEQFINDPDINWSNVEWIYSFTN